MGKVSMYIPWRQLEKKAHPYRIRLAWSPPAVGMTGDYQGQLSIYTVRLFLPEKRKCVSSVITQGNKSLTSSVYLITLSESEVYRTATKRRSSPRGMSNVGV